MSGSRVERPDLSDDERHALNRRLWDVVNEQFSGDDALRRWNAPEIEWGLFGNTESQLQILGDVAGLDVVELGCGSAYFSAWLARRGARPIGLDLSPAQLQSARRCQAVTGVTFPLVEASAEDVPLTDDCADLIVSDYGASVWCDPWRWVPEAARLLRPNGRLVFITHSRLVSLCVPADGGVAGQTLHRPQAGASRVQWPGGGIEFHPSHGEWIEVLTANSFVVDALHELYAQPRAEAHRFYDIATPEWATQWPVEDVWVATSQVP